MTDRPLFPRTAALGKTLGLLGQFMSQSAWARRRFEPGIADFAFGNPHDMPLPAYIETLQRHAFPENKDWFAYKNSEPASQAIVAASLRDFTGVPFEPADIAMTTGGFAALAAGLKAVTEPGDEVIYSLPPWFCYEMMIVDNGLIPVKVRIAPATFDLDLAAIEAAISPRTRVMIVNTPHNPTGKIYPPPTLERLASLLDEASHRNGRRIYLLSDEPYNRIVFDGNHFHSPAAYYPHTLIAYSYGKVLLTPGQRIGYLAIPPGIEGREELHTSIFLAQGASGYTWPNALLQHALADLEKLSIDIPRLQRKRDRMVGALREMGYAVHVPEGTFYLLPQSPLKDDVVFAALLAERDIFVLPGTIAEIPGYFRISLTVNEEMIERSLGGFAAAMKAARAHEPTTSAQQAAGGER
jgi:aspartate aminotransferase